MAVKYGAILSVILFCAAIIIIPRIKIFRSKIGQKNEAFRKAVQDAAKAVVYIVIMILAILNYGAEDGAGYYLNGFIIVISGIEALCNAISLIDNFKMMREYD